MPLLTTTLGYPLVRHAKHLVDTGVLGKLRVIQVEYAQDWLTDQAENTDNKQAKWRTDPEKSGLAGCLGDIGTDAFNLARFISGQKVQQVSADLTAFVNGRRLDDNVHTMLRFDGGAKGMLWSSQVAPGNENGLKIRLFMEKKQASNGLKNPLTNYGFHCLVSLLKKSLEPDTVLVKKQTDFPEFQQVILKVT